LKIPKKTARVNENILSFRTNQAYDIPTLWTKSAQHYKCLKGNAFGDKQLYLKKSRAFFPLRSGKAMDLII